MVSFWLRTTFLFDRHKKTPIINFPISLETGDVCDMETLYNQDFRHNIVQNNVQNLHHFVRER